MATIAVSAASTLGAKCGTIPSKPSNAGEKPATALLSLKTLSKFPITSSASHQPLSFPPLSPATVFAAALFSSLSSTDAALAAQQIADLAEGDSRGLALLIPIVPAIAWVLYNILQPALNQINRMRKEKGIVVGFGLGLGMALAPGASAGEVVKMAEAASGDNRGLLLLVPVGVAIAWVLFNILQSALNQINRMRSG
ncbi:hypothetical protein HPP92_016393 [Vanilla planifolia]|uniref:Photosystem II core complex proteins psbY, chloroplastic n=1 Tax=Vanilla planifolia TaxID=51239 RepID=A0A835US12_VANPL|nr:hypothetical protein HPP92_016393 [Vanilla planifolia]